MSKKGERERGGRSGSAVPSSPAPVPAQGTEVALDIALALMHLAAGTEPPQPSRCTPAARDGRHARGFAGRPSGGCQGKKKEVERML